MNLEIFQPYLKYVGIGALIFLGIALLLWLGLSFTIAFGTRGAPKFIGKFFLLIAENDINEAYQLTTSNYRSKTSKQKFTKFVKTHNFKTYKRTLLGFPTDEFLIDRQNLTVDVILLSGKEIPTIIDLVREDGKWLIDRFELNPEGSKSKTE